MADTYKILGQSSPAATTDTAMITVGAGKSQIVSTVVVCNTNSTPQTYRLHARIAGAAVAVGNALVYEATIAGNETVTLTLGITLAATDVLGVRASATNVTFTAFGDEVS